MGTHCAPRNSGASDLSGLMETNSMPASFARRSHGSMVWAPAPPEVTWPFLVASPPNARMRRVCLTIDDQPVVGQTTDWSSIVKHTRLILAFGDQSVVCPTTGWKVPITRGRTYCAAP